MSEQPLTTTTPAAATAPTSAATLQTVENTLVNFTNAADVKAVYGTPVFHGEVAVIPAAEVLSAMGFGVGAGGDNESGSGGGGGGGGRVLARPVAAIIIAGNTVRVEPVVDVTKVALGALTAFGFVVGMWARMNRRGR